MNSVFIVFCVLTVLSLIAIIITVVLIKHLKLDTVNKELLSHSLIFWILLFGVFIAMSGCTWQSDEELYKDCMNKVKNTEYCSNKYLDKVVEIKE